MEIRNNTFIVTGGASGLGEGTVRLLAENGANVIIADMNEEKGNAVVADIKSSADAKGNVHFVKTDVTNEESATNVINYAVNTFDGLQGVISCAGLAIAEKTLGKEGPHSLTSFKRVIEVNLIGSFNMLRLAAAQMSKQLPNAEGERGVIINTASVAAYEGQMGQVAYSASKGGIVGLTLPAARDLSRNGIRICGIAPGLFDTPLLSGLPPEVKSVLGAQVPFPSRLGKP